ncbi:MAG: DNA repair protein RecN [Candidatus Eisenbacteria bacterium]
MLTELKVTALAVVEEARLELGPGFVVLTGETGAGKSLLVGAIGLLVGERADAGAIRAGEPMARVEGRFTLDAGPARAAFEALLAEWGIPCDDGEVIVRREVVREGRSRAWVNQVSVTLKALEQLGAHLVDVHGQHEHQSLLRPEAQRDVLDRLAGAGPLREATALAFEAWRTAADALAAFAEDQRRAAEQADGWRFAHEELSAAALVPGEDEALATRLSRLRHAGRLVTALTRAGTALEGGDDGGGGALHGAAEAERALREAAAFDPTLSALADECAQAALTLGEVARALEEASDPAGLDPAEAEAAEERHAKLERLARKYHRPLTQLIAWRDELATRLAALEDQEGERARLAAAAQAASGALSTAARALTALRARAATKLERALPAELTAVGLARAALTIELTALPEPTASGADRVEFRFAPNAGEEPRPLGRIASGGETSRVMLALQTLLAAEDGVDALLFDEVDSGIGGAVARAVGERLARLGQVRQVLCVTHLPVIACQAERQFRVHKLEQGGRTLARIERVEGEERIGEIARMLAGDAATGTTRRQARELLRLAP